MPKDETSSAAAPKDRSSTPLRWLTAVALSFGALLLLMRMGYGGPGTVLLVLPWFVPVISLFQTLIHLSVAFVALGRYQVLQSPPCLWIGLGSAGFGVSLVFYALTWPGLLPTGGALVGTLPGTPAWALQIGITIFSALLLAGGLSRRSFVSSGHTSSLAALFTIALVLSFALLVRFEHNLPPLLSGDGVFSTPLLIWNAAVALLFTGGALFSTLRVRKEGDPVVGYLAVIQMAYAFAVFATVTGMRRYDLWWYLLRLILTGSGLVLLFGLLREYVVLLRSEREQAAELLRAEEKLRENEREQLALLESVVAGAGSGIALMKGRDLVYTLVNPAYQAISPGTSMVGRRYRDVFPEAAAAGTEALYQRVLDTGEPWLVESYHAPVPGKPDAIWQGHVVRLPSEPGSEPSALAAVWDITERVRAEHALAAAERQQRHQREFLEHLIDHSPIAIAVADAADLRFTLVNPAFQAVAGRDTVVIGRTYRAVFPEAASRGAEQWLQQVRDTGKPFKVREFQTPMPGRDGMTWWEAEMLPLPDPEGMAGSILILTWEITERKKNEAALLEANEDLEKRVRQRTEEVTRALQNLQSETEERLRAVHELQEKERMLIQQSRLAAMGEMISNIAHQWRQPLNALGLILQNLSLIRKRGVLSDQLLDGSVQQAKELIRHMSATIDDFRNFFSPDKSKTEFRPAKAVENAVTLVEASFKSHRIRIVVDVAEDATVTGYPNEYAQAIMNILTNAKDAFETRRPPDPLIRITVARNAGKSVVTISDNAGGIPREIVPKIFDPHFTTKGPQGTGIGLFMAKTIVEKNMNGRLSARNTSEGAEFTVEV